MVNITTGFLRVFGISGSRPIATQTPGHSFFSRIVGVKNSVNQLNQRLKPASLPKAFEGVNATAAPENLVALKDRQIAFSVGPQNIIRRNNVANPDISAPVCLYTDKKRDNTSVQKPGLATMLKAALKEFESNRNKNIPGNSTSASVVNVTAPPNHPTFKYPVTLPSEERCLKPHRQAPPLPEIRNFASDKPRFNADNTESTIAAAPKTLMKEIMWHLELYDDIELAAKKNPEGYSTLRTSE
ncbi:hypothetical protein [Erwinia tasmaniensis]|uniref:Uncharacterized protein n=1 Tax=Erwinia tasmaniensis (strain DSM 17950 / CFBP 7177 / CIP 109463 / NCPPB 4357 / Et1/99) TaxID=465817 RepID=B2VD03_ERWT9|nr:hypothetical protein [Erwinia tasmaniensis]CAO97979.1 hypothetical protein ETA_29330 [Erwinia tasmaniensis Et1/99]